MSGAYPKLGFTFLLATLLCTAGLNPVCSAQQRKTRRPAAKPEQPTPQPAPPPAPLTLEQMPAVPPHVAYRNGELTIVAQNSTLGDILRAVRTQTGAAVEIPANATERVVSQLGPAPARDVLASLLNGSHFNYVMLGTAGDPSTLERVILTPKSGGGEVSSASQTEANQPVFTPPQPLAANAPASELDTDEVANDDFAEEPSDDIENLDSAGNQAADPTQQPNGQQGVVKTPEQLLQELQQQQQQQQQRMQKLPPGFPVPPNQQLPQPPPPPQQQ